jgi:hypothetical protein
MVAPSSAATLASPLPTPFWVLLKGMLSERADHGVHIDRVSLEKMSSIYTPSGVNNFFVP